MLNTTRCICAAIGGFLWSLVLPVMPYAALCTAMVAADTVTAWTLSRRVARAHPDRAAAGAGKFQSRRRLLLAGRLGARERVVVLQCLLGAHRPPFPH